ncbi:MAG: M23 family metallopeptidase [Clostridia bacterium]|nr:M23 family metallopeptidase [Clostridia bacterium]
MASDELKLLIHTANPPQSAPDAPKPRRIRIKTRLSFQERLLRNSCLACAVLLGVLALGNLNQPWAKHAAESIEHALTMEIDLDESLGQLSFVQRLMPESALVFFNLSGDHELQQPVQGELSHPYSAAQPWLMFAAEPGTAVCAPADGTVAAVSQLSDGSWGILIDHGEGMESVVANLKECAVQTGDKLLKGAAIGTAAGGLFLELRQGGEAADPTEKLGL